MNLQHRINLLLQLGEYILSGNEKWQESKSKASAANGWFTEAFIELAANNIANNFLQPAALVAFASQYSVPPQQTNSKTVGVVMAGNIPLVGFHDLLCIFLTGHKALIKASAKDEILIQHLVEQLCQMDGAIKNIISFSTLLKNCDAYIATGSNNTARYFDYYFGKYPNIIRRNRTSVALLTGDETKEELVLLADDVHTYFGLGCRNVTKLYVPAGYDFVPLLEAFKKYQHFSDHHKYKNNYDYQLALHLLNNKYYMTNGSILLSEDASLFSPISQLNYAFYETEKGVENSLAGNPAIQCIVGNKHLPFGHAQIPSLYDFADGVDTMQFLSQP